MDVCIDTDVVVTGIDSISATIDNLGAVVSFLTSKFASAGEEFQTINYERTSENVQAITQALDEMGQNLQIAQQYLNELVVHIERYNSFRF